MLTLLVFVALNSGQSVPKFNYLPKPGAITRAGNNLVIVQLPGGARSRPVEKKRAIVVFQNQVQLWESDRYVTHYNFISEKPVPFGEHKLSGYRLVPEGQAKFGELTIQTPKGQQRLRVYWRPDQLGEWVRDGITVFHYDCLL